MLHGTKNPVKELISTVRRTYGLQILRNGVHSKQSLVGKPDIDLLSCSLIKNFSANDREILLSYGLNFENVTGYARIQVLREVFTSLRYNGEKTGNNYSVCFADVSGTSYGEIDFFCCRKELLS